MLGGEWTRGNTLPIMKLFTFMYWEEREWMEYTMSAWSNKIKQSKQVGEMFDSVLIFFNQVLVEFTTHNKNVH